MFSADPPSTDHERPAVLAGRVRLLLSAMGVGCAVVVPALQALVGAFVGYLAFGLAVQFVIARGVFAGVGRVLVTGVVDLLFLTFVVQRLGSVSTVLPAIYIVIPVLYATTTSRRGISATLSMAGTAMYASTVALEVGGVLPYGAAHPPSGFVAVASVVVVAVCAAATTLLTAQLIVALAQANARLRGLSQHDELTGLFNRRYVTQRLATELARLSRTASELTVAMIDLDGFKQVNDEVGHDAGDDVLAAVAGALVQATRKVDTVARYGGDEFVVLFPGTGIEGAQVVGQRMLDEVRSAARGACPAVAVSASVGMVGCRDGDDAAEVLRRVDERLYEAKRAGGNRVATQSRV